MVGDLAEPLLVAPHQGEDLSDGELSGDDSQGDRCQGGQRKSGRDVEHLPEGQRHRHHDVDGLECSEPDQGTGPGDVVGGPTDNVSSPTPSVETGLLDEQAGEEIPSEGVLPVQTRVEEQHPRQCANDDDRRPHQGDVDGNPRNCRSRTIGQPIDRSTDLRGNGHGEVVGQCQAHSTGHEADAMSPRIDAKHAQDRVLHTCHFP